MAKSISIQLAATQLTELVNSLAPGEEILLTDGDKTVAAIVRKVVPDPSSRKFFLGAWKGKLEILNDSDDEILENFKDYFP